ncbi:hypothetical protein SAMN05421676_10233 [Salinibacillus kushneri]|uniref:Uncharacterized protein n=1 Tax=Salinibacillus kushneri TaxID=237682 RepID=A0A1I0A4D7_9BACI|nr:hypothetical protein [Salinibacillus kushneri]SES89025.1 hypothetical protein SAMN05421676_10233 [Salinibacillus kushneri]
MNELIKEEYDNLLNIGVGNKFDYVGVYKNEKGVYLIDRTDGQTYTDDYLAEDVSECVLTLFDKVEEMIDEAKSQLLEKHLERKNTEPDYEKSEHDLCEDMLCLEKTALSSLQYSVLKGFLPEHELRMAEQLHNRLVAKYELEKRCF